MKISEFYKKQKTTVSFEFFPPKTEDGEKNLFESLKELKLMKPSFVSVTYGAMGTTRTNTIRLVTQIKRETRIETAAHLTCVGHTRDEIETVLGELRLKGIENIVALRGDTPKGEATYQPLPDGFAYASELVHFIRNHPKFSRAFALAVAGYPEGHVECKDKVKDLEHLKRKVDEGADVVITQLFFINRDYFQFVERARAAGIQIPIVPGIMPVTHGPQIQRFAQMCGATIPPSMANSITRFGDNQASVEAYGIEYATRQCEELLANGAPGLHFYTLNKSTATRQITKNLKLASSPSSDSVGWY